MPIFGGLILQKRCGLSWSAQNRGGIDDLSKLSAAPKSLSPERWGEESQGREDLQAAEQRARREHRASEGLHPLVALGCADLPQSWPDHVQRGSDSRRGGEWVELGLYGDEQEQSWS